MANFHLSDLEITVNNLEVYRDTVRMEVAALSGVESSGFDIRSITTLMSISGRHMHFDNLAVKTGGSDLKIPALWFDFEHFSRFKKFSYEVDLHFSSKGSYLTMEDLAYFVPEVGTLLDHIDIDGMVNGKLNDMKGDDLMVTFDGQSSLAFDFMMIGLPKFSNTFLDFKFRKLNTSVQAINDIVDIAGDSASQFLYPWNNLGELGFTGHFTGYPDQFVASGLLATNMGRMVMDLSFKPDSIYGIDFLGRLRTNDFQLGEFFNVEQFGKLDMDVYADGNLYKGAIRANMEGTIDTLEFHEYAYSNITLDGAFTNQTFDGGFSISDPNIKLDFQGRTDFSGDVPVHRFTADVARARPYYLNLPQSDPNYFASFLIETDLSGRTIDKLNGEVKLINSLFEKTDAQVQLYDLSLVTRNTPQASLIQVRSELADVDVTGQYQLTHLPGSFRNMADHFLNVIPNAAPQHDTSNYFVFQIDIKHLNPLLDFFYPTLKIGDKSSLSGTYDPLNTDIRMQGAFPTLEIAGNHWHQVTTNAHAGETWFESDFRADSMTFGGGYTLQNQEFQLIAGLDTAKLDITWDNGAQPAYRGKISLHGTFQPDTVMKRGLLVNLEPGTVIIHDKVWDLHRSEALLRRGFIRIDSFDVSSTGKQIRADGIISSEEGDDFQLELQNLNLAGLAYLTGANMDLQGEVTGFVNYRQADNVPVINTSLKVDSLFFNKQFLGNTRLDALWNDAKGAIEIRLNSEVDGAESVEVSGSYIPKSGALDFDIDIGSFALASLNPYTAGIAHNLTGAAHVNMTLDGTLKAPELNGTIGIEDGAVTIDYINARYLLSDDIRIYRNNFFFENFKMGDQFGNGGRINGSVSSSHLRDFYINLNIDANNIQCMNTGAKDNEDFYGNIFGTGSIRINGAPDNIRLSINATTEKNTALYLPLYNASEVVTNDFITFVGKRRWTWIPGTGKPRRSGAWNWKWRWILPTMQWYS